MVNGDFLGKLQVVPGKSWSTKPQIILQRQMPGKEWTLTRIERLIRLVPPWQLLLICGPSIFDHEKELVSWDGRVVRIRLYIACWERTCLIRWLVFWIRINTTPPAAFSPTRPDHHHLISDPTRSLTLTSLLSGLDALVDLAMIRSANHLVKAKSWSWDSKNGEVKCLKQGHKQSHR